MTIGCAWTMPAQYDRGGLLPMAVFLTENSPGLRTSPVKRGNWVVNKVLGEMIPPPPPVVPELPHDEAKSDLADARHAGRSIAPIRCAPRAMPRFDASDWRSKATVPWAKRAPRIWPAAPWTPRPHSPAASQGVGFEAIRGLHPRASPEGIPRRSQPQAAGLRARPFAATLRRALTSSACKRKLAREWRPVCYRWSKRSSPARSSVNKRHGAAKLTAACHNRPKKGESDDRPSRKTSPAAPFFAAPASPWRCRGCRRYRFRRYRARTRLSPSASGSCSWATASTRITGAPRARRRHEAEQDARAAGAAEAEDQRHRRPLHQGATGQGIHPAQTGSLLSGAHIQKGAIIHSGISVDQMIANNIGQDTPQSSIVLACEQPMTGYHETNLLAGLQLAHFLADSGFAGAGGSLSVAGLRQPVRKSRQPAQHEHSRPREGSRRGAEHARSAPPTRRSSTNTSPACAKWKSASTACARPKTEADDAAKAKNRPAFTMERPANGLPEDLRDHARLMCDIIAIAFQTDKTRVASLILARDLSAMYYPVPRCEGRPPRRIAQQYVGRLRAHRAASI